MVLFNKIQFSVKNLEKCFKIQNKFLQKKSEDGFNHFFKLNNKESNLFGQTFIFRRNSGKGQRNLFGYGSSLNKNSLFFLLLNKKKNLNFSLFKKYFNIKKNYKIQEKKKKFKAIALLNVIYEKKDCLLDTEISIEEVKGEAYNLDYKITPYLHLHNNLNYKKKNYRILSRYCIHNFFNNENTLDKSIIKTNG